MKSITLLLRPDPKVVVVLTLFVVISPGLVQATQGPTSEERLIRLETKVGEGFKAVNQRIDDLDSKLSTRIGDLDSKLSTRIGDLDSKLSSRIDGLSQRIEDLKGLIYVILAGMFALVGFVIWDRRTALAPAIRKNRELEEREERIERALKEFASKEPRLADALKHTGLL